MRKPWSRIHSVSVLVAAPAVILAVGLLLSSAVWAWIIIGLILSLTLAIAGQGITGLWRGMFIDERNSISLTRLQTAAWTIVVVSAFLAAGLSNIRVGLGAPLDIAIPGELWALLGISATSLVGTPLIRSGKQQHMPRVGSFTTTVNELGFDVSDNDVEALRKNLRVNESARTRLEAVAAPESDEPAPGPPSSVGVVLVKNHPKDSAWSDIFKGEDTGNGAHLDLGKIQMFYFTLAIVLAYVVALGNQFADFRNAGMTEFPALTGGIVALLGISHAALLANSAVDRP